MIQRPIPRDTGLTGLDLALKARGLRMVSVEWDTTIPGDVIVTIESPENINPEWEAL